MARSREAATHGLATCSPGKLLSSTFKSRVSFKDADYHSAKFSHSQRFVMHTKMFPGHPHKPSAVCRSRALCLAPARGPYIYTGLTGMSHLAWRKGYLRSSPPPWSINDQTWSHLPLSYSSLVARYGNMPSTIVVRGNGSQCWNFKYDSPSK